MSPLWSQWHDPFWTSCCTERHCDDIKPVSLSEIKEPCHQLTNTNSIPPLVTEIQRQSHSLPSTTTPDMHADPGTRTRNTLRRHRVIRFTSCNFPLNSLVNLKKSVTWSSNLCSIYINTCPVFQEQCFIFRRRISWNSKSPQKSLWERTNRRLKLTCYVAQFKLSL